MFPIPGSDPTGFLETVLHKHLRLWFCQNYANGLVLGVHLSHSQDCLATLPLKVVALSPGLVQVKNCTSFFAWTVVSMEPKGSESTWSTSDLCYLASLGKMNPTSTSDLSDHLSILPSTKTQDVKCYV